LIDLGAGRNRLGGSALALTHDALGAEPADLDDPQRLIGLAAALGELREAELVLAYHDRSDGGVFATLVEMAFAGHCGLDVRLPEGSGGPLAAFFSEELGAVLQVRFQDLGRVQWILARHGLGSLTSEIGAPTTAMRVRVRCGEALLDERWSDLRRAWSELSFRMRGLRDDPDCAREEYDAACDEADAGLRVALTFDPEDDVAAPYVARGARPKLAILREQGVNSQVEAAAAFDKAGFEAHDVHMTDLLSGRRSLAPFHGLVACGGFSYGDVLGAGEGWAKSILFHPAVREDFARFFARPDTFAFGVCNGCQMFAALKSLIPGAESWPRFVRNRVEQFEGRFSLVEIVRSPSILFADMIGSVLPIAVAHGEGRAEFASEHAAREFAASGLVSFRYVTSGGETAMCYPANPSGSPFGLAAATSADGRVTITMPHPERSFRYVLNSWHPPGVGESSGWMRLFRNARRWLG
jgi:phosphoribosylformylglycinamidine synthase